MINKKSKKKQGFTLVEMVIVITILGILSGIGFLKFGEVQQTAKINADKVAASGLVTATNLAIQSGEIEINKINNDTDIIQELVTKGFITVAPRPQSKDKESSFKVEISEKGDVSVLIDKEPFYPEKES
ncbi:MULTISPECIES: prepilin-type N-terminal cleavage/methylation domain-containing protein [unclassified Romboutsia]|uniref:prepilin-type N-terminal cleavage/methylation domain-containing protein n=1 Tax=unclassified Romboutsia TaxID=2626894 RepID=UPI0018989B3B|nr:MULTISPECIES: prepilin-type N-terminal cleavage/methylation domain-containing protein [unclassified Romboutsia]MDB8805384.1 prepilin-type N-terminal cleavage/methylation domain-containing protein [Romboutsia sp. 1001216sp1]MDB8809121.1 prepilin-type N-terminal cleavage/methylation domain-containing protein [Romboutsia sp. 1001216sp1]MDB8811029.1 prepilin-type N-terminal cleavage/methylation domain-containing protein [Romboutsia sp. 1001216sp1]MDB8816749.1 prepilin-type N-terminal cleavage/me